MKTLLQKTAICLLLGTFSLSVYSVNADFTPGINLLNENNNVLKLENETNITITNSQSIGSWGYFNESSNVLMVDLNKDGHSVVKVELMNKFGENVYQSSLPDSKKININLSGNEQGIYILKVITENAVFTEKIGLLNK